MAKVKITGHASGSGVITVTAPNTSTDRTITLPDATATIATTASPEFSGTVGVGVTPEGWSTTFDAIQFGDQGSIFGQNSGTQSVFAHNIYHDGAYKYITTSQASRYVQSGGSHVWSVAASGSADAAISLTDVMTITNDGRGLSQFTAKAWVNFNGTGTVAIRDSHNVSSITDLGVGTYRTNFSNSLASADYAVSTSYNTISSNNSPHHHISTLAAGSFSLNCFENNAAVDQSLITEMVFGD